MKPGEGSQCSFLGIAEQTTGKLAKVLYSRPEDNNRQRKLDLIRELTGRGSPVTAVGGR